MSDDYFSLLGLKPVFNIDLPTLETNYRQLQSAAHPDRFVAASAAEQIQSMQVATKVNDAYRTLKSPASRAAYLLSLNDIDALAENNTSMPADFLMQQMEWREQLADASQAQDEPALEQLLHTMQQTAKQLQSELTIFFDEKNDLAAATETTRKLIFIDKVCADIDQALEALIH